MAFRVRNDGKTEFWLKEEEEGIILIAAKSGGQSWSILTVKKEGVRLHPHIGDDLGFEKNSCNRIKIL